MTQLKHYGVLGMRWGVRRAGGTRRVSVGPGVRGKLREVGGLVKDAAKDDISKFKSFASRLKSKAEPSADFARSRQLKKKPISKLSNEELKTIITRLQLEKQLKDLDSGSQGKGKRVLRDMLLNIGGKLLNVYAGNKVDPRFVEIFEQVRKQSKGA
jgi:hypothetical protein